MIGLLVISPMDATSSRAMRGVMCESTTWTSSAFITTSELLVHATSLWLGLPTAVQFRGASAWRCIRNGPRRRPHRR